ncbi:DUF5047 domain-containing protein [Streptomyces sp. DH37]|uniref:DUF5047 domain-containing protein n=1 Tax=Streptomyces sp. DH37 TaxID=3040122 RepID=UPI0024412E22|nr:DUF5047 domain-containing protein [Streptomyces sp. DH37]MDG9703822.1 DUF5047 domain-containing protein [Streptomyces sp. DH37]
MYPAPSATFLKALTHSHVLASRVELHWPSGKVDVLPHTGGQVTADRGQAVRRTARIDLADPAWLPYTAQEFLDIAGCRVRVLSGIHHPGWDRPELVPIFTGRLDGLEGDPDIGPVTLTASGLESFLVDDKFTEPYSTRGATAAVTSIRALVQGVLPDAIVTATAPDTALGARTWDVETEKWTAVQEIATAVGADVFADVDGIFRVEPLPDLLTAPVAWEVAAGEGGALISVTRGWSRAGLWNAVLARGENTEEGTPPVTGYAEDNDPTSPTYVGGRFGRVVKFHSSPTLTSSSLAQGAANKLLADGKKAAYTADISSLPNPLLEPGDVLRAKHGSGRRSLYQIQSLTIDLSPGGAFDVALIGGKEDA